MAECSSSAKTIQIQPEPTSESVSVTEQVVTRQSLARTAGERLSAAEELKERGNEFYKDGDWRRAGKKYHAALLYIKAVRDRPDDVNALVGADVSKATPPTKEETERADILFIKVSNNLAACLMKLKRWPNVLNHTSSILDIDPTNVKALYRRGLAHQELGNLDEAKVDLQTAHKLDPSDVGIKKQLPILQQQLKDHWESEKRKYQGMF